MCPAAKYALLPAGHAGPALQGAAVAWGGQGRLPLRTLSLRASPQTGAAIRFSSARPLDKPVWMGIIVDVRGRCIRRSAPSSVSDLIRLYSLQKPSLSGVAVFVFQLHNTNRNGIPPDVESKYPVHVCHPLSGL